MSLFDTETVPTFTLEEFVYSWVPGMHWIPRDIESLGYTTGKLAVLVAPLAIKAAWLYRFGVISAEVVAMHGGRWTASWYLASQNSWGMYRLFSKAHTAAIVLSSPYLMVAGASFAAQYHTLTSPPPTAALASEPGQTSWWRSVAQAMVGTGPGVGSWTH